MTQIGKLGLLLVARIAVCCLAPLMVLLLMGAEGRWLAIILGAASLPLIGIACLVGLLFAPSIISHPLPWAAAALLISLGAGFYSAGQAGLVFGGLVALPAAITFLYSLRRWPLRRQQATAR